MSEFEPEKVVSDNKNIQYKEQNNRLLNKNLGRKMLALSAASTILFSNAGISKSAQNDKISIPKFVDLYNQRKEQVLARDPSAIFHDEDMMIAYNSNILGCSSGQETFEKATIDIGEDRRSVKIVLNRKSQSGLTKINGYDSPEYMLESQCDTFTKYRSTLELAVHNKKKSYLPRRMLGKTARKALPWKDVINSPIVANTDPLATGLVTPPIKVVNKITLRAPYKLSNKLLKSGNFYIGFYSERKQRDMTMPKTETFAEMMYLRPITSLRKTTRRFTVPDTAWSGRVLPRKSLLTSPNKLLSKN